MIDEAVAIAREAGALLLERYGRLTRGEIHRKGAGPRDLVTAADQESERLVVARLSAAFPDHAIVAEDGGGRAADGTDRPTWIVDPLDGTTNYVQGIPFFCVSLGLVEGGSPVLGVVHAPALGQTFSGTRGEGAWEDGRPVSVSATPMLSEAVVATGFAYERDWLADHNLDNFVGVGMKVRGLRRFGAAALDLAYVASGRLDGFWELHLKPWDVAAGAALVVAAGGRVTDFRGGTDFLHGRHVVATNGLVHEALRTALAPLRSL
jgi:myo-inositol-1(or 4)-monophosphatase